jgi:hypothetical protein
VCTLPKFKAFLVFYLSHYIFKYSWLPLIVKGSAYKTPSQAFHRFFSTFSAKKRFILRFLSFIGAFLIVSGFLIYFFTPVTLREAHPVLEYEEQISIPPGGMDSRNISSVVLKFFCAEEADISITPTTLSLYLINESEYSKIGNLSKNIEHFRLNSSRFTLKFLPNVTYIILMKNELNENITAEYKVRAKVRILAPDLGIQPVGFYLVLAGMIIFASNIFESPVNELYRKIKNFFLFKFFPEERGMPPRKDRLPMIAWLSWTSLTVFLFYLLYVQLKKIEYIILKDSLLSQLKDLFLPLSEDIFTRIVLYVSIVCAIPFLSIILCALIAFILNYFLSWFVGVRYGRVYDPALQRKVEEVAQRRILSRSSFIFYLILSVFSISIISMLTRYDVDLKLAFKNFLVCLNLIQPRWFLFWRF